jgi:hypothetical protein
MLVKIMGRKYIFKNILNLLLDANTNNGRALDEVDSLLVTLVDERVRKIDRADSDIPTSHWGN